MTASPFKGKKVQGNWDQIKDRVLKTYSWMPGLYGNVLDADGPNETVRYFKSKFPSATIQGLDESMDFNRDEFPCVKAGFDYILSFEVLEHLMNPVLYLDECKRVLKDNGKMIMTTPMGDLPCFMWSLFHFHEMSKRNLMTLLDYCGFKITRMIKFRREHPHGFGIRPIYRYFMSGCCYLECVKKENTRGDVYVPWHPMF